MKCRSRFRKNVMLERTGELFAMIVKCTIQAQLSKSLLIIHNKEIGLLFSVCCIESFICTGVTLFFFFNSEVMRAVRKEK